MEKPSLTREREKERERKKFSLRDPPYLSLGGGPSVLENGLH
jgi:hypothetical protein